MSRDDDRGVRDDSAPGASAVPGSPVPGRAAEEGTTDASPVMPRRSGVDVAREALAAARAQARQRQADHPGRRRLSRQPDVGRSGSRPEDRDPQPLGSAVRRLLADRGWTVPVAVSGVLGRWAEIVGPELAAHCRAESFDDGTVVVVADSTAWATQVRLLAPQLVRRLNEQLGDGTVQRVDVRGPGAPSWAKGRLRVRGRGPRDTYG